MLNALWRPLNPVWTSTDGNCRLELRTLSSFADLQNWARNRPADELRVSDLHSYLLLNHLELLPGIIYVWEHPPEQAFYVYDGIHRVEAARRLPYTIKAVFHIRRTSREQEIVDDFVHLNKAISVPSVYLEERSSRKRNVCELVVQELSRRYPQFLSSSRRPFPYNFNRDVFMDQMSAWDIDFRQADLVQRILRELDQLNTEAHSFVQDKNIRTPVKCVHANFYLFYLSPARIASHMRVRL
jgi:hypothetical protein